MNNYTPDLSELRDAYIAAMRIVNAMSGRGDDVAKPGEEFDRGISQVKAEAWDEAYNATCDAHDVYGGMNYEPRNPYRKATHE